jgi:hypothetical protein
MSRRHRGTRYKGGPHVYGCCGNLLSNGKANVAKEKMMRKQGITRRFQNTLLRRLREDAAS